MRLISKITLIFCLLALLAAHFYYPKWDKSWTEATISWDVSGYYMYLPALFIYDDLKGCGFQDEIIKKYQPTSSFQQAFKHSSGKYVMKYALGQSLVYLPFFGVAHLWAQSDSRYEADGFSFPYQLLISISTLVYAFIGLILLRLILLRYFDDGVVALTLIGIVLGSNYLNYSAIDGAMTHNSLFTLYTVLIFCTIKFYENPRFIIAGCIGLLVGWMALIRPTEIISCLIPLLWGIEIFKKETYLSRIRFIFKEKWKFILAICLCGIVGSLQLFYWKYVSGEWIVYSYEDQGFSWLNPHLKKGFISYKSGWLTYSPLMVFSIIGFYFLYRLKKPLFLAIALFSTMFIYIAFAWDIWWYGASLGQRAMVQAYPILAFPLAAFISYSIDRKMLYKVILGTITIFFIYVNLWWTHQAHLGGLLHAGQMTKAYFWEVFLDNEKDSEDLKLLDGLKEIYKGERKSINVVYRDSLYFMTLTDHGQKEDVTILIPDLDNQDYDWMRVSIDCGIKQKEWYFWTMSQMGVKLKRFNDQIGDDYMIRIQRHLAHDNMTKRFHIDIRKPDEPFTHLELFFWNPNDKILKVGDIQVETYNEE